MAQPFDQGNIGLCRILSIRLGMKSQGNCFANKKLITHNVKV